MLIKSRLYPYYGRKEESISFLLFEPLSCINICFPFKNRGRRFAIMYSFTQVKPRSRKSSFQLREWIRTGTPIPERHTVHAQCTTKRNDDLVCDRDATTLFSFIQSITHSFIRYTQHTAVMSAIFDFSSLITVFVLSICTTTYLRELRPAIFDTSIPSMAGGDGGGRTPSAVGSFQSDDATTTNAANNNQSLSPQQRQQAHHHREGIMGFLWKLSRIGERCSPYISIACILQALNILFWK